MLLLIFISVCEDQCIPNYYPDRKPCSAMQEFDDCNEFAHCRWEEKDAFEKSLEVYSFSKSRESFCHNLAGMIDAFASAQKQGASVNSTAVCMEHVCPRDSAELCSILGPIFGFGEQKDSINDEGLRKRSLLSFSKESHVQAVYGEKCCEANMNKRMRNRAQTYCEEPKISAEFFDHCTHH